MSEPHLKLPLALVQDMVNILRQLPYENVAGVLNQVGQYKAAQTPGLASVLKEDELPQRHDELVSGV